MVSQRKLVVPVLLALAALAGIIGWYFVALSAVAAESGELLAEAAVSAEGIVYGLRAIVLAAPFVLVLRFFVQAKDP